MAYFNPIVKLHVPILQEVFIILLSYAKIAQGEYFWDADPGEASGSVLVAADGNFDSVIENVLQSGIAIA